jgi:hypothetical protein
MMRSVSADAAIASTTATGSLSALVSGKLDLPPDQFAVVRSVAGPIVAGVATGEEE